MDPNATLSEARAAYTAFVRAADEMDSDTYDRALCALAEHFNDLDEWLTKGGFLPSEWSK